MAVKRSYGQGCPVAHALDMIGERWALLVVRELRLGARRFTDLEAALPGIGPNVLSQRLRDLERVGVLRRRALRPPAGSRVYELTEWGAGLEPVFAALATWGARSPVVPLAGEVSDDSVMLGLRTFFDSTGVRPWTATYDVDLGREAYRVRIVDGRVAELRRGDFDERADAAITTDQTTFQDVMDGRRPLQTAIDSGLLNLTGDHDAVQHLIDSSRRPIS